MTFLKKLITSITALLAVSTAFAQTATTTTTTPTPTPVPVLQFSVGGGATFNGFGLALFQGAEGFAIAEKSGGASTLTELAAGGDLCGATCSTGSFKFAANAWEHVTASAGARSLTSGVQAGVVNSGGSFTLVNFAINKTLTGN